mmetsp:Transcript_18660/g.20748  ORF Transcript_18660/g.20748 Transcript_18660/m.20748 type:complete len:226 (-) Transcript_18660:68-745(-)
MLINDITSSPPKRQITCPPKRLQLLSKLPSDIVSRLFKLDQDAYITWPLLCRRTSQKRFDCNMEKKGEWTKWRCCYLYAVSTFSRGRKNGLSTRYFKNGLVQERCYYIHGKIEGTFTKWHPNGKVDVECFFKEGIQQGEFKKWYPDGKLEEKCFLKEGKPEGEYVSWKKNGQVYSHVMISNGVVVQINALYGIQDFVKKYKEQQRQRQLQLQHRRYRNTITPVFI